jgi:hypothetical protein
LVLLQLSMAAGVRGIPFEPSASAKRAELAPVDNNLNHETF